jgi:hypothetical protein
MIKDHSRAGCQAHPYIREIERYGCTERVFAMAAFARDLVPVLGAELQSDNETSIDSEFNRPKLIIGDLTIYLRVEHGAQKGRVGISCGNPALERQMTGTRPDFPRITVDASRPLNKLAADIKRRVIEDAAEPLAKLRAMVSGQQSERAECEAHAAKIRDAFPQARIEFGDPLKTEASFHMDGGGTWVSGRLQSSGALYVDRVGIVRGARVLPLLKAMFGPTWSVDWTNESGSEAGEFLTFDPGEALDFAAAKRAAGYTVSIPRRHAPKA